MQLKYFGSKAWLAPHMDRLLGTSRASLPVFLRSLLRWWGAGWTGSSTSGTFCRALRDLRAQQLLGKVGLLHTAAAAGTEQRAASAAATLQRDRAAPGRAGLSTRSALPATPSLHFPRPQHELLWYERGPRPGLSHAAARRTLRERPALRRQRQRRAGGPGALQRGRLLHKPVLGQASPSCS